MAVCRRPQWLSRIFNSSFHCSLAPVVAHLCRRLNQFQLTYTFITFCCLFAFWLPWTKHPSFRRNLKNAGSIENPLIPSNTTREWCPPMFLMREVFSFLIEPYSLESSALIFGFIDESSFQLLVRGGYAAVVALSAYPHTILLHLPIIERINHRRLLSIFQGVLFPLIFSPIAGQLVSGFIDRPLDMLADFRLNSLFIVQIIGFLLCLFSSFVFGVIYASVQQSKLSLDTSWSFNNGCQSPPTWFLSLSISLVSCQAEHILSNKNLCCRLANAVGYCQWQIYFNDQWRIVLLFISFSELFRSFLDSISLGKD